jgi:hypothetical protein
VCVEGGEGERKARRIRNSRTVHLNAKEITCKIQKYKKHNTATVAHKIYLSTSHKYHPENITHLLCLVHSFVAFRALVDWHRRGT